LVADHVIDQARGSLVPSKDADPKTIERIFRDLERAAESELRKAGVTGKRFEHERFAQCRYAGQTWDIDVPVAAGKVTAAAIGRIAADFHRIHEDEHTYARADEDVLIAGVRVRSRGLVPKPEIPALKRAGGVPRPVGKRKAYFASGWRTTSVFDGEHFPAGRKVTGPAIIEEPFTTIVVPPGWTVKLDLRGNYVGTR
jgi:N-methylhydantoinase A